MELSQLNITHLRNLFRGCFLEALGIKDLEFCEFAAKDQAKLLGESGGCGLHAAFDARKVAEISASANLAYPLNNLL